jgi:hypothetical protein
MLADVTLVDQTDLPVFLVVTGIDRAVACRFDNVVGGSHTAAQKCDGGDANYQD